MKGTASSKELLERAFAQHRAGKRQDAESSYRKVISRSPQNEQALFGLSVLFFETGRFEEASRYLERLVAMRPSEPVFLTNLGEAYRRQGEFERAAGVFRRILEELPDFPEAEHNLGITLMDAGAPADALPHLEQAVELRPDSAPFHVSLAWALLHLKRADESANHARRALELAPNLASAHHHLANALDDLGDRTGAVASYRRAIELDPSDYGAHSNLILVALTDPAYDAAWHHREARSWAKLHAEPLREHIRPTTNDKSPERRLRVGYVSPDLRAHPVLQFLMPLLDHHDPSVVEVFLYGSVDRPDFATDAYRAYAGERYRDIRRMDDLRAAELVRRDRIDILVDLALHSGGRRLRVFACKPAPVQMTWLGYSGTTGLDTIDYRITDPFVDPPGTDLSVYSEESLHLPETSWCYAALESGLEVGPLPALAAGHVTFGAQSSFRKVHPGVLALWSRVLREVPSSRLLLYAEEHARAGVLRNFEAAGIGAERIEFGGRLLRREYLERYQRVDIALDAFPFTGATTNLDAAFMGVPFVTLTGGTAVHRAGACVAGNLGMPELVASSEDDYVEKAVALARDLERLSRLRAELRSRLEASPLGNASRFARHLEAAYRTAWRRYCAS